MKKLNHLFLIVVLFFSTTISAQPNWPAIKSNATFIVPDTSYDTPYIQPINVPGWEDGLFMTRDGKHLFSTYLAVDALSWINHLMANPACFNFDPYFKPPLLGIDTVTNIFSCPNYMQSDIIIASRANTNMPFNPWTSSNLQTSFSFDGAADGVLMNADSFDVFVFTKDGPGTQNEDIMFMRNVPINPNTSTAVPILSTTSQEDNPHIERLNSTTLLLFFDRDRHIYYSLSYDNGTNWQPAILITNVLNDQAPYDVQPHLWNDGTNWWVYFCANNVGGVRCIYKSKQLVANNWNSWGPKELVIQPDMITGGSGNVLAVGEPTLTQWGDLSFVVVYGNTNSTDTTDIFDCDPWFLPKKNSLITGINTFASDNKTLQSFPNPANENLTIKFSNDQHQKVEIQLYNSIGAFIKKIEVTTPEKINISELPPGLYFIRINDNINETIKFIKIQRSLH